MDISENSCLLVVPPKTNELSWTTQGRASNTYITIILATNGHEFTLMPCGVFKTGWILVPIRVYSWFPQNKRTFVDNQRLRK